MFWIFCFSLLVEPTVVKTELFHPLDTSEVLVSPAGEVYVLNFAESSITRYDASGKKLATIGYKGEGPGGLLEPDAFFLEGSRLFVLDKRDSAIEIFDLEGGFLESIDLPYRKLSLDKVSGGWVFGDWEVKSGQETAKIFLSDLSFKNVRQVLTLETRGKYQGLYSRGTAGKLRHTFYPVTTQPKMLVDPSGSRVFVVEATSSDVHCISVADAKVTTLVTSMKPIPFDKAWAESRLELYLNSRRDKLPKSLVKKMLPKDFPRIRNLTITPEGYLALTRWVGNPDVNIPLTAWDLATKQKVAEYKHPWSQLSRVIAVIGQTAFVSDFDTIDEVAKVVCLPVSNMWHYLETHPIVFKGMTLRTLGSDY